MKKKSFYQLAFLALLATLVAHTTAWAATEASWNDTPATLREVAGVSQQGNWLFATGVATATPANSAKANELARKRSLFETLKLVRFAAGCSDLISSLPADERDMATLLYTDLAPDISIQGLQTLKQWEKGTAHFTTAAVPLAALPDSSCGYQDLEALFGAYIEKASVSPAGLDFALSRVSRHTALNRKIRESLGGLYASSEAGVDNPITLSLASVPPPLPGSSTSLDELRSLNRIDTAMKYVQLAERLQVKNPEESQAFLLMALGQAPLYSRSYLLLSDLFLKQLNKPAYGVAAAEKSLRDGTSYYEALQKLVAALDVQDSPEAEVFSYLMKRSKPLPKNFDEKALLESATGSWGKEVERFKEQPLARLVLFSLGQAIEGAPQPAPPEFKQASKLFGLATRDEDFKQILTLLMIAIEKAPYCPETYNLIGTCFRYLKKPELALPFLWQSLKLRPDYDFALTNLGLACEQLGLKKSAGFYFDHQAVKNSTNSWVQSSYQKFVKSEK